MIGFGRRWPRSARITAGLALVCGLVAFGLVQGYVGRVEASRPELVVSAAEALWRAATSLTGYSTARVRTWAVTLLMLSALPAGS